jgi:pSer/pThr/pTyr-binding forkhead associated (FHA) protein
MRLIVKKEGEGEKEYQIARPTIQIGRATDCDVTLSDKLVSRKHAKLTFNEQADEWSVEDMGSANKTYLNGKIITKSPVKTGDELEIGGFLISINLGDGISDEDADVSRGGSADSTVDGEAVTMEASLGTPKSETVVRKPDSQHAPAMRLAARRLTDFSQAAELLCEATSLDQLLVTLMDLLVRQFNAFHVWCALREQPSGPMTYHAGKRRDGQKVEITDLQLQEKIVQAMERKQSLVLPRVSAQMESKDRIRSAMIAPVIRSDGCYGLLYVDNAMVHEHYSLSDLDYLMLLAMHTASILKGFLNA